MADVINFPGTVEWSGENPGISLKATPDGPFVALASFFRVVLSPHGRGHALMLLQSPQDEKPGANYCLHDNEKLARYLVSDFVAHFGAWKGLPGLKSMTYRALDSVAASGDPASTYHETVKSGDLTVQLTWSGLGAPFCFALPPEKSATGQALDAEPVRSLPGREHHGQRQGARRQARAARDGGPHPHHRDAGVLGDVDPRVTS